MNKNIYLILLCFISVLLSSIAVYLTVSRGGKTAYVRTQYLIENYEGMKEAKIKFKAKFAPLESQLDSLKLTYNVLISSAEKNGNNEQYKAKVGQMQNEILNFQKYYESVTATEDENMTIQILNQVNSYIKEYGEDNNYSLVLGTTSSGNLLYGKEDMDITDDVLKALNNKYRGKK